MDQTEPTTPPSNLLELTVSDLAAAIKRSIEDQFGLVRLKAEISGLSKPRSGHLYFALKDENAVIDGVMWRGNASRLGFEIEDGLAVVVEGKLTTYAARSKYQLIVERIRPDGVGALMAQLDQRRKKLAAEGLFDDTRKQSLPVMPGHIGVITSPTGAVIRDILHRLRDRFPVRVSLWPVKVQGDGAATEIANAIAGFQKMPKEDRPDLLIVARGGGSLEDLWSFNEETVVRAAAASAIPLISAVGHETDTTLIDYAADKRAPTPTGAAEIAVPVRSDLMLNLADQGQRLTVSLARSMELRRERVNALARALPTPKDLLGLASQRLDDWGARLPKALERVADRASARLNRLVGVISLSPLKRRKNDLSERLQGVSNRLEPAAKRQLDQAADRLNASQRLLDSLSHQAVMKRGFALIRNDAGQAVTSAADLASGDSVRLSLSDGTKSAMIQGDDGKRERQSKAKAPKTVTTPAKRPKNQGELF